MGSGIATRDTRDLSRKGCIVLRTRSGNCLKGKGRRPVVQREEDAAKFLSHIQRSGAPGTQSRIIEKKKKKKTPESKMLFPIYIPRATWGKRKKRLFLKTA